MSSDETYPNEKAMAKQEAFLQKDYELKIAYLTDQFARMWNRFNYFVAIETALVGGKFLLPNGVLSRALVLAGILISALWYVMGAEDRYLVRLLLSDNNSSRYRQLELPIRKENIQPMQAGRSAPPHEKSSLGGIHPPVFSEERSFGFQDLRGNQVERKDQRSSYSLKQQ